jgi:hypothetical protein
MYTDVRSEMIATANGISEERIGRIKANINDR